MSVNKKTYTLFSPAEKHLSLEETEYIISCQFSSRKNADRIQVSERSDMIKFIVRMWADGIKISVRGTLVNHILRRGKAYCYYEFKEIKWPVIFLFIKINKPSV